MTFEAQTTPQAPPPSPDGRYQPDERLSDGAFFVNWRGRDTLSGRTVALLVLKPDYALDAAFVERLDQELRTAQQLRHPNVIPVYDAWRAGGTLVVATELVRGTNLRERLRRVSPFPLAVAADIAAACAEALQAGAQKGLCHGDLSPENVVITPQGEVKVGGFGVGASLASSTRTQVTALSELAPYLSPERAQGSDPTPASDVYSLGALFYEMLAGVPPFQGDTPLAVAVKHLHDPPPPLKKHNPGLPNAAEGIALKCLQKIPGDRYPSASALLTDLEAVREGLRLGRPLNWTPAGLKSAAPPPPPASAPAPRPVVVTQVAPAPDEPSARLLLLGLLGMVAAAVAAFFGLSWFIFRATPEVGLPDVRQKTRAAALDTLREAGLKWEIKERYNDRVPKDVVFMQDPVPPRAVKQESLVEVYVSKGAAPATVPDVVGKPVGQAQEAIREAGLTTAPLHEEFSDTVKKGEVMAQEPSPGTELSRAAAISLTLSKGPEPVPVPKTVEVGPIGDQGPAPAPESEPAERQWEVTVRVPDTPDRPQNVRITVEDESGVESDQYNAEHQPGEEVQQQVSGTAPKGKVRIRVYIDGKKVSEQSL